MATQEAGSRRDAAFRETYATHEAEEREHHPLTMAEWKREIDLRQHLVAQQFGDGGHLPIENGR